MKFKTLAMLILSSVISLSACEIAFDIEGGKQESYKIGDEFAINVKVNLTHRVCKIAAKDTKFKYDGLKIIGATEWKEAGPGVFTRTIKVKLTGDPEKVKLVATRTCDKEGGLGVFSLSK
jgi:hypothetical protein